jgi:hypothetical protein
MRPILKPPTFLNLQPTCERHPRATVDGVEISQCHQEHTIVKISLAAIVASSLFGRGSLSS